MSPRRTLEDAVAAVTPSCGELLEKPRDTEVPAHAADGLKVRGVSSGERSRTSVTVRSTDSSPRRV